MEVRRNIRLFFVHYGRFLFSIIGGILLVVFCVQSVNRYVKEQAETKEAKPSIQYTQEEILQKQKKEKEEKAIIQEFLDNLIRGDIQKAYDMLSTECKEEKYISIDIFQEQYVKQYFSIPVIEYQIKLREEYVVQLQQDPLITGKTDAMLQTKFKIKTEILQTKLEIIE